MNKTKIEWCDYTWNPVTGYEHNCPYCYAKKIAMRFTGHFKPTYHKDRIGQPYKLHKKSKIFVCSMADLFGSWVDTYWILDVLETCFHCKNHTFMFLTKNPKRYQEFDFPENCMIGVTMDVASGVRWKEFEKARGRKFVSCEPLLEDMSNIDFGCCDQVIVGADKNNPPKKEWIDSIKHKNILYKQNIKPYMEK